MGEFGFARALEDAVLCCASGGLLGTIAISSTGREMAGVKDEVTVTTTRATAATQQMKKRKGIDGPKSGDMEEEKKVEDESRKNQSSSRVVARWGGKL